MHKSLTCAVLVTAAIAFAAPARAADKFEIQVYQGEHNRPWQPSIELHTNFTFAGRATPSYEGEVPADGALRLTLEPALGITEWLELGAYLQGMRSGSGDVLFSGWKLRAKFVVPERLRLPVTLGMNIEVGRVPLAVDQNGWANEFRPIIGGRVGRIGATLNPLFGFSLTGPQAYQPDFEPAGKVKVITDLGFAVGAEYYAGLGQFSTGFLPYSQQEHLVFAAFDLAEPPGSEEEEGEEEWELNVGIGRGLTSPGTAQDWIAKVILGRAF